MHAHPPSSFRVADLQTTEQLCASSSERGLHEHDLKETHQGRGSIGRTIERDSEASGDDYGMPEAYSALLFNDMSRLDRRSAYWGHRAAANTAHGTKFNYAYPRMQQWQQKMESDGRVLLAALRDGAKSALEQAKAIADLRAHYARVAASAWAMADEIMQDLSDGYVNGGSPGAKEPAPGYPRWWLESKDVGFTNGPAPITKE